MTSAGAWEAPVKLSKFPTVGIIQLRFSFPGVGRKKVTAAFDGGRASPRKCIIARLFIPYQQKPTGASFEISPLSLHLCATAWSLTVIILSISLKKRPALGGHVAASQGAPPPEVG